VTVTVKRIGVAGTGSEDGRWRIENGKRQAQNRVAILLVLVLEMDKPGLTAKTQRHQRVGPQISPMDADFSFNPPCPP
jgi:hypothetical protein